jgi:CDP-glycerol glycerophosphotransferase
MTNKRGTVWFATLGRFSTEKNHDRLLHAFSKVLSVAPHARLVVAGYGPLREHLERTVIRLGLETTAFIVGPFGNPFPILKSADCFVLSSNYEGQPMVLLEAAIAGLPIVSVEFQSVRDALPGDHVHVVDQSDGALAAGMLAYLDGHVAPTHLDIADYNSAALTELTTALAIRDPAENPIESSQ